jgi:hypothetical protein
MMFIADDFPRSKFHKAFYQRLSNTFGQIANHNSAGFYGRFFLTAEHKLEFLEQCVTWPCHGDTTYPYSDVEHAVVSRLTQSQIVAILSSQIMGCAQATGARASFGTQGLAQSRPLRRRLPLRSRTCSADRWRRSRRSRRLSRTGIRNQ